MSKKKKMNATPDSIVLGISGEALLVMGALVAFAGRPEWHSALTLALPAVGLFLVVWGFALAGKRNADGEGMLTVVLVIMGAISLVFGLLGFFNIVSVLVSGIPIAATGIASDIVLAVVAKKAKNKSEISADSVSNQD